MDEELLNKEDAAQLHFRIREQNVGYKVALAALLAIGWTPSVLYDAPEFLISGQYKLEIDWGKLKWRSQSTER